VEILFSRKYLLFTVLSVIFIGINILLLLNNYYWAAVFPLILIFIYLAIKYPDIVIYFVALATPLSYSFEFDDFNSVIVLPTEPRIILLTVLAWLRIMYSGIQDKRIWKHPVSIIIFLNLIWVLITSFTSTLPLVSFKFFASRLWYVTVFYLLGISIFKNLKSIKIFIWLFSSSLVVAVLFILYKHSHHFFTQEWSNKVTMPFFKDHTIYGAVLAFFIPILTGFVIKAKELKISPNERLFALIYLLILIPGLVFSFTRAAWMSVFVALGYLIIILLRIKFHYQLGLMVLLAISLVYFWPLVKMYMANTKSVSSDDLRDHLKSVSNISTDISNTERINRWVSAIRMYKERPVFGFGPGTYIFKNAPYQLAKNRTPISTDFGKLGNAHSEYIGPLSESGLPGMLTMILLVLFVLWRGTTIFYHAPTKEIRIWALLMTLSLITYFSHGLVNNFLHTDKASVPFWAFIAVIVALDSYYYKSLNTKE